MKPTFTIRAPFIIVVALFIITSCSARRLYDPTRSEGYPTTKRNASVAFINPGDNGGSQLDSSAGLGEPLNVIISGLSSPEVLTTWGIITWARSVGFTTECFGFHIGNPQTANLGDGRGWVNETGVLRYDYDNAFAGSCLESLIGGNHFRFWNQVTTGAWFLAVSVEDWAGEQHNIVPDGYDLGRDSLVIKATGKTQYQFNKYSTTAYYISGLLKSGTEGINHNISIDGKVAVLTITRTVEGQHNAASPSLYTSPRLLWSIPLLCVAMMIGAAVAI